MPKQDEPKLNIVVEMVPHPNSKRAIDTLSKMVLDYILEQEQKGGTMNEKTIQAIS